MKVATAGWRRRCLYLLLVALLVLSIVNLSLTLLVLKTTYFDVDGMGNLHVSIGGLDLEGTTRFLGKVRAAQIDSRKDKHLVIEGYHNLALTSTTEDDVPGTFLHIGVNHVTAGSQGVRIDSSSGQPLFETRQNDTLVGADRLTVTGSQGAIFQGSLQTPLIYSRDELRLESATRGVSGRAAKEVILEARDGDISVVSSNDLTLRSRRGNLRFDTPNIYLPQLIEGGDGGGGVLPTLSPQETQLVPPPEKESLSKANPSTPSSSSSSSSVEVYQVCVCPNGRLFLMEPRVTCEYADDVCR